MYKYWISLLGTWLICLSAFATEEPTVMKSLRGSEGQLKPDSSVTLIDSSFYEDLTRSPRKFMSISNKNIITFTLDEGSPLYLKSPFSATLTFQLYYSFKNTPAVEDSLAEYSTLVINYDTAAATPYRMRSYFEFDDAVSVRLKIISISTTASGWDPLPALMVTNEMRRERVFTFDCEANKVQQILFTPPPAGADELQVYWNQSEGADEYDLEWVYIDQQAYNTQLYGDPGNSAFSRSLFRNNASRVTLKNTESGYKIPLLYEKNGKLFFRVRAVQMTSAGKRTETHWSDDNSFDFVAGHQSNLNWQSVTSFAEEGKRKSVVQYFDGSLRSRQTVTKDNTTGTTVVAENFYDYQGRPVIQVLPSPTIHSIIQHTPHFNQFLNTGGYYKDHFDKVISGNDLCSTSAPGLDAARGGAAQYYSPQNPEKNNENNHLIPDAEGFPYSETRYMRDNTGRIAAQGGVGKEHRINQGHDTKYYYGTPEQNELDALFGTEAGDASHYFKNMVRDANGQYSVSYLDMHGRTIATALAGELPPDMKLDYLPSKENREMTSSLINASNNIVRGFVIESSKTLVVPLKADYKFTYSLLPENINIENCAKDDICYSCSYDLEITISDDCGNRQFGGTPYVFTSTIGNISEDCNDLPSLFTKEISQTLEEGSYAITKKLTIRDAAINAHTAAFMENNLCRTVQDFVDEQMTVFLEQTNNCTTPCGACMLQLGESQPSFITKFISENGLDPNAEKSTQLAQDMYQRLSAQCSELCGSSPRETYLDQLRQMMLMDVTPPAGQYADPNDFNPEIFPRTYYKYSIFGAISQNNATPRYTINSIPYKDANGKPALVTVNRPGGMKTLRPQELTIDEFITYFQPSWAEALMENLHPEYAGYQILATTPSGSNEAAVGRENDNWDWEFRHTETFAEAWNRGYLNPTNNSAFVKRNPAQTREFIGRFALTDPFFVSHPYLKTQMEDFMVNVAPGTGETLDIWAASSVSAFCKDETDLSCLNSQKSDPFTTSACDADLDMAWRAFRALYISRKDDIIRTMVRSGATLPALQDPSGTRIYHSYFERITTTVKHATGINNPTNKAEVEAALENFYQDGNTCAQYAGLWWSRLAPCNIEKLQIYKDQILADLVAVCQKGTDKDHIMGASSIAPDATNTYKDFDEVLAHYVQLYNVSHPGETPINELDCNGSLLDFPAPYSKPQVVADKPILRRPTDCECDKLAQLMEAYKAEALDADFSAYISRRYGYEINQTDLDELENRCSQSAADCRFLSQPIMLPPIFQCNADNLCANCEMVADAYGEFKTLYPEFTPAIDESGDEQQGKINQLFSHYMNQQLGLSKQAIGYLAFLDSCGIGEQELICKNLTHIQELYNRDINPYRFESFLQSNYLNPNIIQDWNTIISDGMLRWPQDIRDTTGRNWVYFQHMTRNSSGNKFCIQNGYSIEWSFKSLKDVLKDTDDIFYFQDANISFTISRSRTVNPGIYIREIKELAAEFTSPVVLFSGSLLLTSDPEMIYKKWSTVKLSVTPADVSIYFDNRLIKKVSKTSTSNALGTQAAFTLAFFDYQGALDWIKMYDANGNVTVHEDYNDPSTRAIISPTFLCPRPVGDCKESFTAYFNQKRGTSYTFDEIESLYQAACGERLDVCGNLQYQSDNLQSAIDGYYLNANPGLAKHKVQTEGTILSDNPVELFKDGFLQLPEPLQGPEQWYHGYQIDFKRLCTQNGFAVEHRFKLGNSELSGNLFYTGHRAVQAVFSYYPNGSGGNLPGLYIENITLYAYDNSATFNVPGSWLIKEGDDFRNMWLAVKTVVKPNKVEIHLNNQKIWEYDRDPGIPINQYENFGLYPRGTKTKYDYIKIWDSNDNLVYYENFNNGYRPAVIKGDFICVTQQDCSTAFTNYFNGRFGTGYTYQGIEQLYQEQQVPLNICGGDPDFQEIETLEQIEKDFNMNLNPYRIRVDCQSNELTPSIIKDLNEIYTDGKIHWPDRIRDSLKGYFTYFVPRRAGNYWEKGYGTEFRFKFRKEKMRKDEEFFYASDANQALVLYRRSTAHPTVSIGISFNLREEGSYHAVNDPDIIFNEWNTVKYEILPTEKRFYYNGNLIVTLPNDKPIKNGVNSFNFMTYEAEMDYVKWYDGEGKLVGEDNFDVTDTRPIMEPDYFVNNYGADCQAQFTKYYNEQRGTQLNFEQIDERYFNTLGKHLDICGKKVEVHSDHQPEYSKIYKRSGYQEKPLDMLATNNGQIIVGRSESLDENKTVGLAVYLDANGKVTWSKQLGDKNFTSVSRIIQAENQEFILAGTTDQSGGSLQPFAAKINSQGNVLWSVTLPLTGIDSDKTLDITTTASGNYVIAVRGETKVILIVVNSSGNVLWEKTYQSDDLGKAEMLPDFRSIQIYEEGDSLTLFTAAIPISENKGNGIWCMRIHAEDGMASESRIISFNHATSIYHIRGFQSVKIPKGYILTAMFNTESGLNKILRTGEFYLNKHLDIVSAFFANPTLTGQPALNPIKTLGGDSEGNIYKAQLDVEDNLNFEHFYRGYKTWGRRYLNMAGQPYLINGNAATNRYTLAGQAKNESGFFIFSTVPHAEPVCGNESLQDFIFTNVNRAINYREVQVTELSGSGSSVTMPVSHYILTVKNHCAEPAAASSPFLCNTPTQNRVTMEAPNESPCADSTRFSISRGYERYSVYTDSIRGEFVNSYIAKCLQAAEHESFTVTHAVSEYHYTLYYYDQAGNLVKTVPPNGVRPEYAADWTQRVAAARDSRTVLVPAHKMETQYRYNTLNQVVTQKSPDGGKSQFWYDRLGRLVLSQNARQAVTDGSEGSGVRYSYTLYDHLSRITEVGQIGNAAPAMTNAISRNPQQLQDWFNSNISRRGQVTLTVYDQSPKESYLHKDLSPYILREKNNLRNRVSFSVFSKSGDIVNYDYAAFYNYDIQGNVDTLLQDYGATGLLTQNGGRYKRVAYTYDLISGKVNTVSYQPRLYDPVTKTYIIQPDAFYHKYEYDAENRLTDVYTSIDELHWEHDAAYRYYKHGPLSRMVLGDQQVQGLDYAYTLQGWLKGVNSTSVGTGVFDAGEDGISGANNNQWVGRDAFGFSLQYYSNDYTSIKNSNAFAGITSAFGAAAKPLYNGNISSMAVNIPKIGDARVYAYSYDQLNRITAMDAFGGLNQSNNTFTPISLGEYQERISYDANGNILSYSRNGNKAGAQQAMDRLTYHYKNNTNQLIRVRDAVPDANYTDDIDDQPANNYDYDAIGNLIQDIKEGISKITWTVYGKIESITKTDGTAIAYSYDAAGNRITKAVTKGATTTTTAYVRDARGNVLSIYTTDAAINSGHLTQSELHLYAFLPDRQGSNRLGILYLNKDLSIAPSASINLGSGNSGGFGIFERNKKLFELSNHLGNVLATVSDKKIGVDADNNGLIDYYTADVISAQDYFSFGMMMPGRKYASGEYRYGFNGAEAINEIYGSGNLYSFDFRESDPRLGGQFWSIDPLAKAYPGWSPYAFAQRRPIDGIELEGLEWKSTNDKEGKPNGYQWDPDNAWNTDKDGNKSLKDGYYHQAVFFSENGIHDASSKYNMGSSTATVFKADGTNQTFNATSYPSDLNKYPIVPEGTYEANVGLHKGSYTALRMHSIGNANSRTELGFENPAFNDGRTYASGINIHKPGLNNLTGMTSKGSPCSAGCMLIDRNNWDNFIGLFNSDAQRDNTVGITISRTYAQPVISKYTAPQIPFLNKNYFINQPDNTRVAIPIYLNLKMKK